MPQRQLKCARTYPPLLQGCARSGLRRIPSRFRLTALRLAATLLPDYLSTAQSRLRAYPVIYRCGAVVLPVSLVRRRTEHIRVMEPSHINLGPLVLVIVLRICW